MPPSQNHAPEIISARLYSNTRMKMLNSCASQNHISVCYMQSFDFSRLAVLICKANDHQNNVYKPNHVMAGKDCHTEMCHQIHHQMKSAE